jgi:DNA-binding MarR family transcriptional regulator
MTAIEDAERAAAHLESIRRILRESISAQARRFPVPLTAPQVLALQTIVDHVRTGASGLSLSELSRQMGLAHSTVSGIVTRLERRGLLRRGVRADDRRFAQIELTEPVQEWIRYELPGQRQAPFADALARASDEERAAVRNGLAILERLLAADSPSSR